MLYYTDMILDTLKDYSNPRCRLQKLVEKGEYIRLKRGLYEDDPDVPGSALATAIYNPSYLSFEYALSLYNLIPETVFEYTSATCGKNRSKVYENRFGRYSYRDVPKKAYPWAIRLTEIGGRKVWIAEPEKALCDQLYKIGPISSYRMIEPLLFDDLRIDEDGFNDLNRSDIRELSEKYRCRNVDYLARYLG